MRRRGTTVLVSLLAGAICCQAAMALTAREILDKAKALDDTTRRWTDRTQRMTLIVTGAGGAERRRELSVYTKRYPGDEEKAITFIAAPAEVRGVGFLQWSHKGRDDEQWLYLPELKRTRQIAARLRDENFVGTDFTFRDLDILINLLRWSEAEAATKLSGEDTVGGSPCHTIELRPAQEGMPYSRIVLWMDRDKLTPRKLDFYDQEGTRAKSLTLEDVRDLGAIPTPHRLEMQNLKKGSRTVVDLVEVKYDTGLSDDLFTQRYLDRGGP
jgi:outer membrane lipoprotein-sorting protein